LCDNRRNRQSLFGGVARGGDRVALRVRVAASACLVASGLFAGGAGSAIALADPAPGSSPSDERKGDESLGGTVREGLGIDGGNDQKPSGEARKPPQSRWGNGRPGQKDPPKGEQSEPGKDDAQDPKDDEGPTPGEPGEENPPGEDPKDPCDDGDDGGEPPGLPAPGPPQSSGGGGGAIVRLPGFAPPKVPSMQLPGELQPGQPDGAAALDAGAGAVAAAAPAGPAVPIVLPVIVVPPVGLGAGAGGGGAAGASGGSLPGAPRAVIAEAPAGRVPPPASVGSNVAVPNASYRIGYTEYLRSAALPQVAALAVPGLAGILVLTGAGGLVGYRQAKAGHAVRVDGSARFMR
jgi:hypothetical protein